MYCDTSILFDCVQIVRCAMISNQYGRFIVCLLCGVVIGCMTYVFINQYDTFGEVVGPISVLGVVALTSVGGITVWERHLDNKLVRTLRTMGVKDFTAHRGYNLIGLGIRHFVLDPVNGSLGDVAYNHRFTAVRACSVNKIYGYVGYSRVWAVTTARNLRMANEQDTHNLFVRWEVYQQI
jgi:hypothetical protein